MKISGFSDNEVLGIIDELTACFVTWLDGHSLVQSVFICMYCHNPYIIEDIVLKAMCIAALKLVDIVRNICTKAKVFFHVFHTAIRGHLIFIEIFLHVSHVEVMQVRFLFGKKRRNVVE